MVDEVAQQLALMRMELNGMNKRMDENNVIQMATVKQVERISNDYFGDPETGREGLAAVARRADTNARHALGRATLARRIAYGLLGLFGLGGGGTVAAVKSSPAAAQVVQSMIQ